MLLDTLILFAQEEGQKGSGGIFSSPLLPLMLIFVIFYFLIILPNQRRQKKQQQDLFKSLKKNDKVVTAGGIIGIIANVSESDDEVTLKLDEGKMKILKSSISRIINPTQQQGQESAIKGKGKETESKKADTNIQAKDSAAKDKEQEPETRIKG